MLDLCIPTYNEADIIAESICTIEKTLQSTSLEWRIILADNGSTDGTIDIVEALLLPQTHILAVPQRGKGAAIVAVTQMSNAEIFGFIDADLSVDPQEIEVFVRHIEHGDADIVVGSRLINTRLVQRNFLRTFSSRLFNILRRVILGIRVADSQCGFKMMNARGRKILTQCTETGWFMDIEFLYRAELTGLVIQEIPVHWEEHRFAGHKSKLRIVSDGWEAVLAMTRIRRSARKFTV
ncbi:glycosyltransferase [Candidatus Kaiserbacteria bacterium]|nr:glycosyltransferase [Candidatus Kaiserbacteria bacterium]